ncbi:MAG: aspartate carbamoyltransferase regulatory subunit [Lachnospiraceae bacterium]|nr:aspartate carbamoyltransferase regulatory subunit [Lachnospiraceae bacterium]
MLNVGAMEEGVVLDHITAGKAMTIYKDLKLDQLDCAVAIITNASSKKMGKKDILKVECRPEDIDLDVLGFYDSSITVNIIENGEITKRPLKQPKKIVNIIKCKNPRCITSIEQELDHVFVLTDEVHKVYRCRYCEEAYHGRRNK